MNDAELIQKYAKRTQDFDFTLKRAEELAAEVNQLREEIRRASVTLSFDDEPSGFITLLEKAAK
ncbi:hypothetical protein [Zwartia sp.]|uniref:hypothetical protein n=1 Tax=Zwartia sp. TaxID=2978004 RepID=UPI00271A801A|nr:hypothetical protein [Zwartia sp.]MDO9024121.1 hypothetical protein [Zwartia sp.]